MVMVVYIPVTGLDIKIGYLEIGELKLEYPFDYVSIGDLCCITDKIYCDADCPLFDFERQICTSSKKIEQSKDMSDEEFIKLYQEYGVKK